MNAPPFGPVYPVFATQAVAAVEPVAPSVAELAGQPVHAASPVAVLKNAAGQAVRVPPFEPVYPAFATQAVTAVEAVETPVAEFVGQAVHAASPAAALYSPAIEQAIGVPPFGPVYPVFATQAVIAVEAVETPVAEFVGQPVQAASPVAALNVPAGHLTAASPSTPLYPAGALQAAMASEPVMPVPVLALVGQALQSAEPMSALKVSAGHLTAASPSTPLYPAGALQAVMASEPVMPAPVFALVGQALQSAELTSALKVSAGHLTAASWSTLWYPAGALQAVTASEPVMPAPVLVLVGQALQSSEPMAALNVSWGHAVAEPPSGPV